MRRRFVLRETGRGEQGEAYDCKQSDES